MIGGLQTSFVGRGDHTPPYGVLSSAFVGRPALRPPQDTRRTIAAGHMGPTLQSVIGDYFIASLCEGGGTA